MEQLYRGPQKGSVCLFIWGLPEDLPLSRIVDFVEQFTEVGGIQKNPDHVMLKIKSAKTAAWLCSRDNIIDGRCVEVTWAREPVKQEHYFFSQPTSRVVIPEFPESTNQSELITALKKHGRVKVCFREYSRFWTSRVMVVEFLETRAAMAVVSKGLEIGNQHFKAVFYNQEHEPQELSPPRGAEKMVSTKNFSKSHPKNDVLELGNLASPADKLSNDLPGRKSHNIERTRTPNSDENNFVFRIIKKRESETTREKKVKVHGATVYIRNSPTAPKLKRAPEDRPIDTQDDDRKNEDIGHGQCHLVKLF